MAVNETVGINLVADTKSLRSQLKDAIADLAALQNKAGASAKEIALAAKRAGELKDRIGDARATVDAFNPDAKFKAFGTVVQGVAGAFAAAQGALALFGVESENVNKQLLKVQGALALSSGLNSILELKDAYRNLSVQVSQSTTFIAANAAVTAIASNIIKLFGVEVVATSTTFKVLKNAIAATGIGLLIVGLGAAVIAFQDFQLSAEKSAEAQKKLNEEIDKGNENQRKFEQSFGKDQTRENLARAKQRGASAREIFQIEDQGRKQDINSQIRLVEEKRKLGLRTAESEAELAKLQRDRNIAQIEFLAGIAEKGRANSLKKQEEFLAKLEKARLLEIERFNQNLQDIGSLELGKYEETVKKFNENLQLEGEAAFKEFEKFSNLRFQNSFDNYQNDIELLLRLAQAKDDDFNDDVARFEQVKINLEQQKNLELEAVESAEDAESKKLEIKKKYGKLIMDVDEKITATEKAQIEARIGLQLKYSSIAGSVGTLLQQVAGDNKALAIAGIVLEQASAVASIAINTQKNAAKVGYFTPLGIAELVAGGLGVISAIVSAKQGIDNINKVNIPGSSNVSAPSISAPIAPRFTPPTPTALDSTSLNAINNVAARAYVVESDITGSQKRIRRIENAARI